MHLEDVTIEGFKSFSEASLMSFQPGIGVIIGSNGVGKSNILDAIAWGLGENDLSRLRCHAEEELFFCGSSDFQPADHAQVELNFKGNGSDGWESLKITRRRTRAGEDHYRISMAVAGFSEDELSITSEHNKLLVKGEKAEEEETEDTRYLYRGIATRSFERRFNLADHVRVIGARLDNGLLHIELEREIPEAMKPKTIEIKASGALLEGETTDKAA